MTDARCGTCRRRLRWDTSTGVGYCPIHEPQFATTPNPIPIEVERRTEGSDRSVWVLLADMLDADELAAVGTTLATRDPEGGHTLGRLGGGAPAGDPPALDRTTTTTRAGTGGSRYPAASGTRALEVGIEWEVDIRPLEYVREAYVPTSTWRDPAPAPGGAARRVGYAVHTPPRNGGGTPSEVVGERRVFYLEPHDRAVAPDDVYAAGAPAEAVDPRTVFPGVAGVMTDRARGHDERAPVQGGEPA